MADDSTRKPDHEVITHLTPPGELAGSPSPWRTINETLAVAAEWRRKLGLKTTDSAQAQREDRDR